MNADTAHEAPGLEGDFPGREKQGCFSRSPQGRDACVARVARDGHPGLARSRDCAAQWVHGAPRTCQTLKLSPHPHSPLALGFWNLKASLSPCLTKSTNVPSIRGRLRGSTTTFTPRASKTASSG